MLCTQGKSHKVGRVVRTQTARASSHHVTEEGVARLTRGAELLGGVVVKVWLRTLQEVFLLASISISADKKSISFLSVEYSNVSVGY